MQNVTARGGKDITLSVTHRAGAEAAAELVARSASAHTRRVYASALGHLAAWLDGRRLDDASLAASLGHRHQTGRAPSTAALVVAAVRRAARDAGEGPPAGPLTRQALEGFRRAPTGDVPARRGQARGLTAEECAAVLATCLRPRRTGRGLERPATAERRGLIDGAIVALLFHGALRRSEVAGLRWADVARSRTRLATGATSGAWSEAARLPSDTYRRRPRRNQVISSSVSASTRSTAGLRPPAPRPVSRAVERRTATAWDSPSSSPPAALPRMPSSSSAAGGTPAWSSATLPRSPRATAPSAATCAKEIGERLIDRTAFAVAGSSG